MNGWDLEPLAPKNSAYAYLPKSEVAPYWTLAHEYVLADRMFASNLDGSFVAHQYTVAAYASHTVDFPDRRLGMRGQWWRQRSDVDPKTYVWPCRRSVF